MFTLRQIRLISVSLATALVLFIVYMVATHGRIHVSNKESDTISVIRLIDNKTLSAQKDIGSWTFLKSGIYFVRNDRSGKIRMARVSVPGWLRSATISYTEGSSAEFEKLATLTYENFFVSNTGSLVSYTDMDGYTSGYTSHDPQDAFGNKYTDISFNNDLISPTVTDKGTLLGVNGEAINQHYFNNKTEVLTPLQLKEYGDADNFYLQRSSNLSSGSFGLYQPGVKELRVIPSVGDIKYFSDVKSGNQGSVFDINDSAWAIVDSKKINDEKLELKDEEKNREFSVKIYDILSKTQQNISIGAAKSVDIIALSPNNKYVAVNKDGQLWVYDITSGKVIMVNPFTRANQLLWQGTKLYSLSTDLGITVFETTHNQISSLTLNTDNALSFSRVIPRGTKLYTTAYNKHQDSKLPDGYVIDLSQPSDNITESLSKKLPYSTDDYDINFLKDTIYIRVKQTGREQYSIERLQSIRKKAQEYLKSTLDPKGTSSTEIVFID